MADQDDPATVSVAVRNVGGIEERSVSFDDGVTILTGQNATNRTSLLRSIAAGLGGSAGELKSDADEGRVELTVDGETYTRTFERRNGTVAVSGEPYTDESTLVDNFGTLLASNPARRAVERGDGDALREIIMEPVDTAAIREDVRRCRGDLRDVEERLDEIERRRSNLPALERRRREAETELDDVEAELADVREAIDEFEDEQTDLDDVADAADGTDDVVDELTSTREEYESVRNRLETQRSALDSLETEREETETELAETAAPESELAEAEAELEALQRRERSLGNTVASLESIVEFNDDLLDDAGELSEDDDGVVAQLDPSSATVECWTCGTTVERGDVADRLDDLRGVVEEKRAERAALREEIEECRTTLSEFRAAVDERAALEDALDEIDDEIERRRARVDELTERETELRERIDELESEAAETEELRDSDALDRYRRLSELEYERGQLEEQIASLDEEIEEIESLAAERDRLEDERDERREELAALRDRIETLEREAIETFNEHMETVLARLGYGNVERVWIERRADGDEDPVPEGTFVLHVVRSGEDGAVYEDTVDHLSESEREVIGLVVALAGYLVHDVHESVPVMLLDSLEAIDADRIADLVEYFAEYPPVLVAALLPEDARAVDDRHVRIPMDEAVA